MGLKHRILVQLCAGSVKDYDSNLVFGCILLKTQVTVAGEELIEILLSQRQQLSILDSAPTLLLHGDTIIPTTSDKELRRIEQVGREKQLSGF